MVTYCEVSCHCGCSSPKYGIHIALKETLSPVNAYPTGGPDGMEENEALNDFDCMKITTMGNSKTNGPVHYGG